MPGACMITPAERQNWWNDHETKTGTTTANQQRILRGSWPRAPPRRQGSAQDRAHARHADLHLERRQSRGGKTIKFTIAVACSAGCQERIGRTWSPPEQRVLGWKCVREASNAELSRKLAELERKYDAQFKVVFDAIRQLIHVALLPRAYCLSIWSRKEPPATAGASGARSPTQFPLWLILL